MKIYQIDSSARKKGSTSRALANKLLAKIKKPDDEVVYRDLDDEMLFVSGLTESGMKIPENERTEQHKKMFELSDKLVLELKESDVIIISVPIYNFGVGFSSAAPAEALIYLGPLQYDRIKALGVGLENHRKPDSKRKLGLERIWKWIWRWAWIWR